MENKKYMTGGSMGVTLHTTFEMQMQSDLLKFRLENPDILKISSRLSPTGKVMLVSTVADEDKSGFENIRNKKT